MKQFLALKASAGSGKTFALTVRYISLMILKAKVNEILTLTFTNKAAAQMTQRIYDTLLSLGDDMAILDAISKETNLKYNEILDKKDTLIQSFISNELSIYTIDKFINKILREFSGYIDINDDFVLENDDEELLLYKFLISLDDKQFNTLISFAHTQSKKLSSIVELFKTLQEKNEIIKTIPFTYAQFDAVKTAILEDANIIKTFIDKSAVSNSGFKAVDFITIDELLDKGKTWLTKDSLSKFSYFKKAKPPQELDENLTKLKQNIELYYQIQESFTLNNLFEIFTHFKTFRESYNKNRNTLEFSDVTNIVYKLLDSFIQKDFLYFRLDTKYNHILIDEFQDTSTLQYKILYHLIDEIISGDPEVFKTFFYVGDIKQSIYRFRGGTKELFDYVAKRFNPMLEVELLDTNYRSSKTVVKFVNDTFLPLQNYDYDEQFVNSKIEGLVEIVQTSIEKEDIYENLYLKVDELLQKGIEANNIAILTYTNKDVLGVYEYLKKKLPNLNLVTEMTSKLINQKNVKALINAVKYLYFKEDIYKTNFNALVGKNYTIEFDFINNIYKKDITTILKELSFYFAIVDENIIKLIELSKNYESIVDFVYDIDKDESTMISGEKNGLSILTIFKSKGLEFDTVITLDRITKKNPDRSPLLFSYDEINLNKIFYKKSNRENLDRYYEAALTKEKKLVIADELNILYVALTRAKNNMIILKKEKNSVYNYLGDFPIKKIGTIHIQSKSKQQSTKIEDASYTPMDFGYQDKDKSIHSDDTNIKARYFGIATHYCLELMKEFNIKSLKTSLHIVQNRYANFLTLAEFKDIENRIENLLENKQFLEIVKDSVFTKEQALIYNNEHKIIDLLLQKEDKFIVIDYKTTINTDVSHNKQVQNYKEAIKKITSTSDVEGFLIYLQKKEIKIVKI
ncbi:MAG: RecB-like helicase [Campylobacterota bacterium]|nr:RecB-like helicase [Campylobacterota bacterium]